jgi:hypothetical protein
VVGANAVGAGALLHTLFPVVLVVVTTNGGGRHMRPQYGFVGPDWINILW